MAAALIGGGVALVAKDDPNRTDAAPTVSSTPSTEATVSPECRAWVREELMDSSEGFDAASGYSACGDLPNGQLDAVIEEVGKEIRDDPSALAEATKTEAEKFQDCVGRTGTAGEKAAVKHVTKVSGTDERSRIADLADVFTDYGGGLLGGHAGEGRLIASAFSSCYKSANGMVTVYDKDGDLLATERY
ncbi:hypothetical protein WKI71_36625 [Streptomyces sp. MS1.AVA.1]|uniref:Uncharacterized protein n=1 Tax=Streptomyces machairae TaxID=3134109 RepID=A0ABU8USJ7_9ACTN